MIFADVLGLGGRGRGVASLTAPEVMSRGGGGGLG